MTDIRALLSKNKRYLNNKCVLRGHQIPTQACKQHSKIRLINMVSQIVKRLLNRKTNKSLSRTHLEIHLLKGIKTKGNSIIIITRLGKGPHKPLPTMDMEDINRTKYLLCNPSNRHLEQHQKLLKQDRFRRPQLMENHLQ